MKDYGAYFRCTIVPTPVQSNFTEVGLFMYTERWADRLIIAGQQTKINQIWRFKLQVLYDYAMAYCSFYDLFAEN
jgi:hypothetical protein